MAYDKTYYAKNREKMRKQQNLSHRNTRKKIRLSIFDLLGFKCCRCGFDDIRALQIDHVNGDGSQHRAIPGNSISYFKGILKKVMEGSKDFQILCANCNWIKRAEKNEQPYANR